MKECWDSLPEIEQTLNHLILKQTFKPVTKYFRDHCAPHRTLKDGTKLMRNSSQYYLLTPDEKYYCKLPDWLVMTIEGKENITYVIGPWIFANGFENTKEGKYLIKIFPYYFNLKPKALEAVNRILHTHGWWIRIHKEYVQRIVNTSLQDMTDGGN